MEDFYDMNALKIIIIRVGLGPLYPKGNKKIRLLGLGFIFSILPFILIRSTWCVCFFGHAEYLVIVGVSRLSLSLSLHQRPEKKKGEL